MPGDRYTPAEDVIIFYFLSRGAMYELVEKLLLLKTGTVRTTDGIKSRVRTVRQNFVDNNQRDPFVLEQWDRQLVDTWLTGSAAQNGRGVAKK